MLGLTLDNNHHVRLTQMQSIAYLLTGMTKHRAMPKPMFDSLAWAALDALEVSDSSNCAAPYFLFS